MSFEPTREQTAAINTKGNVLVSAAAGSGKTAVLVRRVISKLTDRVNPVSADRLLIVTFTNAAAAEMRTRIEKALDEECRKNPDDVGLLRQRQLLPSAKICTIDSFCIDLVRENFDKIGINPDFKISDGATLGPIDREVMSQLVTEQLESGNPTFRELLDIVGAEYDEGKFIDTVLSIYYYSRQLPFPQKWFDSFAEWYNGGSFTPECRRYMQAFDYAEKVIDGMRRSLSEMFDITACVQKDVEDILMMLQRECDSLSLLAESCAKRDWDIFYEDIQRYVFSASVNLQKYRGIKELKALKTTLERCSKDADRLREIFACNTDEMSGIFLKLYSPVKLLSEILKSFDTRIFERYKEENTFTFHNTEHMALSLLCDSNGEFRPYTMEFSERFSEVMVDEYQDTNDLQDMLFYALSDREKKLFVVGDVKQSIYGFRGANPENFLKKKNRYRPIEEADDKDPKKIILGNNFRSCGGVCDYINFFFENIMKKENGGIVYNDEERLICTAKFPETACPAVGLHLIETSGESEKNLTIEARHIADYIRQTMESGECISAGEGVLRKPRYSDFTVLLRNTAKKAPLVAAELRRQGIPVNYSVDGYADLTEIAVFLSLLKVIDNPKSDIDLLCVLMSPIFGFTAEDMALIRAESRKGDLFSALVFASENGNERAVSALKTLEAYRLLSATLPIPKLISRLLRTTGYLNTVSAMSDGARRRDNLLMLIDYAAVYSSSYSCGIGAFADYIRVQSEHGLKSAAMTSGGDTVKIMSIHMSKGLQFPICIVADTATKFNDDDIKKSVLYSVADGVGFRFYDEEDKCKKACIGREMLVEASRQNAREEELRLLYVAMTRAQDRLVFVGSAAKLEEKFASYGALLTSGGGNLSESVFAHTNSYFDWLILTTLLHKDGADLRSNTVGIIPQSTDSRIDIRLIKSSEIENRAAIETEYTAVANEELAAIIAENIKFSYPFHGLRNIESKASVSAIANAAESEKYAFSGRPGFMNDGGITPAERGTAMHRVMQFFDFNESENIDGELERLLEWQFITEREAEAVNRRALKRFFESELFSRIKRADTVKREMRFITEMPASFIDSSLEKGLAQEQIIVQGAVDLCFSENGEIVVLDFKTDRVDDLSELVNAYGEQLNIYAAACEKIFKRRVKEKIIYSFSLCKQVSV